MIKNCLYGILLLSTLAVTGCKKESNNITIPDPTANEKFSYSVNGLRDTSMERVATTRYSILVERKSGTAEKVALTVPDLPQGMKITFEPSSTEVASFNTTMLIETTRTPVGSYDVKIRAASPTAGIVDNTIKVTVLPYSNEAVGMKGEYEEARDCNQSGNAKHDVKIEVSPDNKNEVLIKGFFSGVMSNIIKANLSATGKTITIPSQVQNGVTIAGSGNYEDDKITLSYTVVGSTINESCTATFTRK